MKDRKDRLTKKQLSVSMYDRGMNVVAIARLLRCEPSYVANALIEQGRIPAYVDLYTSTGPQNEDAKELEGVLKFTDADSARASVARIDQLWQRFSSERNRRGITSVRWLSSSVATARLASANRRKRRSLPIGSSHGCGQPDRAVEPRSC